ncbi:MAG: GNVR domain-containing protein [Candidatus Delongbacteria bacterium]
MEPIQYTKPEHEIDLIEIITILWKARKFIAIVTAISLAIGILYIIFATKMYSGTITLYPAQSGAKNPMAAMAAQMGMAGASAGDANYNIPDVVKSRTLSEQIVAHKWEIEGFDKPVDLVEYFDTINEVEKPDAVVTKEDEDAWYLRKLHGYSSLIARNRIDVNANKQTGLITVSVMMEQPKLARDIANFISVFVANWVNDTQKESIRKNLEFINERAAVLGAELQDAENELKKFRETNRNILNSPDLQLELQRLQRQVTIKQEVYLTMIKQREINQIEENKSADVIRILDKSIVNGNPAKPNKRISLALAFLLGIFISFGAVFTYDYIVRTKKAD